MSDDGCNQCAPGSCTGACMNIDQERAAPAGPRDRADSLTSNPTLSEQVKLLERMANRFLAWPLPPSVCSDLCVTDRNYKFPRSGTNLLDAYEARTMLVEVTAPAIEEIERLAARLAKANTALQVARDYIAGCSGCAYDHAHKGVLQTLDKVLRPTAESAETVPNADKVAFSRLRADMERIAAIAADTSMAHEDRVYAIADVSRSSLAGCGSPKRDTDETATPGANTNGRGFSAPHQEPSWQVEASAAPGAADETSVAEPITEHTPAWFQETKELAYKLDPECWVSYSGKPKKFKQLMDMRRTASLREAADQRHSDNSGAHR